MTDRAQKPTDEADAPDDPSERRRQLGRLVLFVTVAIALSIATGSFPTLAVLAGVILMIMLHELGHLLTAKWGGMKVTEYFLGFGPRVWSMRKGETEYGVKALPLGGYVKIPGMTNLEEVDPADEPRTYRQQSFPRRMAVAVAGSTMHFVIAFVLLMVVWIGVGKLGESRIIGEISKVRDGASPAQDAGMRVGDEIVAVDGKKLAHWKDLRGYIRARPGQSIRFTVLRSGKNVDLNAVPADINPEGEQVGFIGVGSKAVRKTVGPLTAVKNSATDLGDNVVLTVKGLTSFFSPGRLNDYGDQLLGSGKPSGEGGNGGETRFLSPVDIVRVSGQAADSGALAVLAFLIGLNIGVGVFNLIPLLPLDGGHVAIAVYERIRSRRNRPYHADVAKLMPVTFAVVGVLVVIVVSSLWLSITDPLSNPFQ